MTSVAAPTAPLRGRRRLLRVGVLGAASLALASGAHVLGGGPLPSAITLCVLALLLGLAATTVTARRVRLPLLLGLLGLQQLGLHLFFDTAAGLQPCEGMPVPGSPATAMAHGMMACPGGPAWVDATARHGTAMIVAHVVATVLTAWLLARGEARLWALADRVVRVAVAAPRTSLRRARPRPVVTPLPPVALGWYASGASPRGPPRLTARL